MAAQEVELREASEAQYQVSIRRHSVEWGLPSITVDQYVEREELLRTLPQGKNLQCWVLVPADDRDTLDFYSSVETYHRPLVGKSAAEPLSASNSAFTICSVFCEPRHRGKGHAATMMRLLHDKMRDRSRLSILYSDVGSYYARCGWEIVGPLQTTWPLSQYGEMAKGVQTSHVRAVEGEGYRSVAERDCELLREEISGGSFAVEPNAVGYEWLFGRAAFYAAKFELSPVKVWGAEVGSRDDPGEWSFAIWTYDFRAKRALKVLRLRAPQGGKHAAPLLSFALGQAAAYDCELALSWMVEDDIQQALEQVGLAGETEERPQKDGSLSAVAFYGSKLDWRLNGYHSWC